jgi:restriction system protein
MLSTADWICLLQLVCALPFEGQAISIGEQTMWGSRAYGETAFGEDTFGLSSRPGSPPLLTIKAILDYGENVDDGRLVRAVAVPWFEFMKMIARDPSSIYGVDWRKWEEIIAGAYTRAGFDDVVLTHRSGDGGRDVIASKRGFGSIRIFDQVKAYTPPHVVSAEEVRAMLGVLTGHPNVSKGIITTTSEFAPRVADDPGLAPFIPYRLELKPRDDLLSWLAELSKEQQW